MSIKKLSQLFEREVIAAKEGSYYPYFKPIDKSWGPEVEVDGKKLVMAGSNDYLGLTHDERVVEAAKNAIERWGAGPGGSRFLSGNMTLHDELEQRLAAFVGKKAAVVHTTGFLTNLGALGCLVTPKDVILCDRENHASIIEGCQNARAKMYRFAHNDKEAALKMVERAREEHPKANIFMITEGVYSMSGDVCALQDMVDVKKANPDITFYLDDAHGLGSMGQGGRGTANHFGVTEDMDFIMGTFSKAMASIGGFIASDDETLLTYLKHRSKTLIFSAALPASNAATVLKCLDILEEEPERVDKLREVTRRVQQGYRDIDLCIGVSDSPIVPIYIGSEEKAYQFAATLFQHGVFALPAVTPAVPKGCALIRTAYMSTHEEKHISYVMEVLDKLAGEFKIRASDLNGDEAFLNHPGVVTS